MLLQLPGASAEEVLKGYEPSESALEKHSPGDRPEDFLRALSESGQLDDALAFLVQAMPRREAVWWACLVARGVLVEPAPPKRLAALKAAETWVASPSDANRRKAFDASLASGYDHPAGLAAVAAFWSGGSITPVGVQDVPVPPHLMPKAILGAIDLAAALGPPEAIQEARKASLALGVEIAERRNRWA